MGDEALREATASERLTLDEEYAMQQSWRLDEDKLTFIVHLRDPSAPTPTSDRLSFLAAHNDSATMIGDVNLFLHAVTPPSSPSSSAPSALSAPALTRRAELEIMLPPSPLVPPRSGLALLVLQTFLSYSSRSLNLPPRAYFARIGFDNEASLGLFRKLGFVEGKRVEVFREVEMVWPEEVATDGRWPWEEQEGWAYEEVEDPRDDDRD
ncbi:hypothetical protein Rhopal_004732-T1 [Rhodotorula paludigena]|uniref:N-acetyltransferase domain-containing protein n=1 Tax=Rhodotorula paludigena TaxID=86838 RepID=A0AAV5GP55_9BASI|nr:hypothetical protein Rhopal_004732-T1 [Rhodotorula paludigena]